MYEQLTGLAEGSAGRLQRGLIGAVGLAPREAGIILPHEAVAPGPVAGRLALMSGDAGQPGADLPAVRRGGGAGRPRPGRSGAAGAAARGRARGRPAPGRRWREAVTGDGIRHRLWAVTDPGELAAIAADLRGRTALIADGHHRYAAYLGLQEAPARAPATGPGRGTTGWPCWSTRPPTRPPSAASTGSIPGLALERAAAWPPPRSPSASCRAAPRTCPMALARAAAARPASGVAFVLAGDGRAVLLTDPDPGQVAAAMGDLPAVPWRRLPGGGPAASC